MYRANNDSDITHPLRKKRPASSSGAVHRRCAERSRRAEEDGGVARNLRKNRRSPGNFLAAARQRKCNRRLIDTRAATSRRFIDR